jgi:predicted RNA-binding protein with PIN domain
MKYYIIDGNNLIGKIPSLQSIHKKDPQGSRERLYNIITEYFRAKKCETIIFFDGYEKDPLRHSKIKIVYSDNRTADDHIRNYITNSNSRSQITLISSDGPLGSFARKCSCKVILSEDFNDALRKSSEVDAEKEKINSLSSSNAEFIKLFSQKNKLS